MDAVVGLVFAAGVVVVVGVVDAAGFALAAGTAAAAAAVVDDGFAAGDAEVPSRPAGGFDGAAGWGSGMLAPRPGLRYWPRPRLVVGFCWSPCWC